MNRINWVKKDEIKAVNRLADVDLHGLQRLLARYQLQLVVSEAGQDIPGSFWGDEEAGLIGGKLYARVDTPIHSIFHEACHYICMSPERRQSLDTNAEGDYDEENAVCYLQIVLANQLSEIGQQRMMDDMDVWGYSFRLGSACAWFEEDADDARSWLMTHGLIDTEQQPVFQVRG